MEFFFVLFNAIIYSRNDGTQIKEGGAFIHISNGKRGVEIPPKDGKFAYNGNMEVILGPKLRTSRIHSQYN